MHSVLLSETGGRYACLYFGRARVIKSNMPIHIYAEEMMKAEALCTEEHAPRCRARCPLHVDMREICRLISKGDEERARELFASAAALPRMTAKLCDAPCIAACRRADVDVGVQMGALERYLAADADWAQKPLSPRFRTKHTAAIVGAGAAGLTAAKYLAAKGIQVTVYERGPAAGAELVGINGVTQTDVEKDIAPFSHLAAWRFSTEVGTSVSFAALAEEYGAVLCTGTIPDVSCPAPDPDTLRMADTNVFIAGRKLTGNGTFSDSLCSGKRAGISMERFLKGVSLTAMRVNESAYETELFTPIDGVEPIPAPEENAGYDENSARAEASRCLNCHCLVCVRECVFMQKFERFPRLYIREIANTISLLRDGVRSGKNLMVACSLCGLCGKLCGIPMERVARLGRAAMAEKGELSEAIYDFPVRDMLFSNGEAAAFCRHASGKTKSKRVFFPGCQLAAGSPETVLKTYEHLTGLEPETGILLGCCGAPADWSGRERLYEETIAALKEKLSALGDPEVVCACPTCLKQLGAAGVNAVSLYPLLNAGPLPHKMRNPQRVAVHDSCAARDEGPTQLAVRSLLKKCGYEVDELKMSGEKTKCCGYGGLVFYGDRDVAQKMIETRAAESPLPYVSYCNVCRDYLLKGGKPGLHLLDVFFGEDASAYWLAPGASISQKEENRLWLADAFARRFYGEDRAVARKDELPLKISDSVRAVLEDRLITERSVRAVIAAAESAKKYLKRPSDGHCIASLRPGIITYWVEYGLENGVYTVYNAYSHRVDISEARL